MLLHMPNGLAKILGELSVCIGMWYNVTERAALVIANLWGRSYR